MTIVRPIEYAEAAPEVRAVYDEIMQARGTDWINNFWKALANGLGVPVDPQFK
jgi:hypothetical protein